MNHMKNKIDFLTTERDSVLSKIVECEINIEILKQTDPSVVLARKVLSRDDNGRPTSTRDIVASEALKETLSDLDGYNIRLKVIDELIKKEQ